MWWVVAADDKARPGQTVHMHALAQIYGGACEANRLRTTDPSGYRQLIERVLAVRRAWWASKAVQR
jgi:hypothetical protein